MQRRRLLMLMVVVALTACGTTSAPNPVPGAAGGLSAAPGVATLDTYAALVLTGDVPAAQALVTRTGMDWDDTMTRLVAAQPTGYTITDVVGTTTGHTATIRWTTATTTAPFCSWMRVRDGMLEMVKQGTYFCPGSVNGVNN